VGYDRAESIGADGGQRSVRRAASYSGVDGGAMLKGRGKKPTVLPGGREDVTHAIGRVKNDARDLP